MKRVIKLINDNEEWLMERVLEYAIKQGCHELNQPLMAVSATSELLMMHGNEDKGEAKKIRLIKNQVFKMGEITSKLMSITDYKTQDYLDSRIVNLDASARTSDSESRKRMN